MTLAKRTIRATEPSRAAAKLPSLAVRKNCFIERLRQTANVRRAAREAGLASSLLYRHRKSIRPLPALGTMRWLKRLMRWKMQ
jgi:hypothetical protein